jgi:hypothetical protein
LTAILTEQPNRFEFIKSYDLLALNTCCGDKAVRHMKMINRQVNAIADIPDGPGQVAFNA